MSIYNSTYWKLYQQKDFFIFRCSLFLLLRGLPNFWNHKYHIDTSIVYVLHIQYVCQWYFYMIYGTVCTGWYPYSNVLDGIDNFWQKWPYILKMTSNNIEKHCRVNDMTLAMFSNCTVVNWKKFINISNKNPTAYKCFSITIPLNKKTHNWQLRPYIYPGIN